MSIFLPFDLVNNEINDVVDSLLSCDMILSVYLWNTTIWTRFVLDHLDLGVSLMVDPTLFEYEKLNRIWAAGLIII